MFFLADLVQLLDHFRLHVDVHVFAALRQERLVDQVAKRKFLAVFDGYLKLFGSAAAVAIFASTIGGGGASFV